MLTVTTTDLDAALNRTARRHGWERQHNQLDYYLLRFTRPEPEGRTSTLLVRLTSHLVEAQVEVGGLRQNLIRPSRARLEEVLAAAPPAPRVVRAGRGDIARLVSGFALAAADVLDRLDEAEDRMVNSKCNVYGHDMADGGCVYCGFGQT